MIWKYANVCALRLIFISIHLFNVLVGDSPLHLAVQSEDRQNITRLLIESGADLNVQNRTGFTPMESAIDQGVLTRNSKKSAHLNLYLLLAQIILGNDEAVKLLIKKGASIPNGALPLAASKGKTYNQTLKFTLKMPFIYRK